MKTNAIVRIALYTLGILILTTILLGGLGVWTFSAWGDAHEINHSSQGGHSQVTDIDPSQIKSIKIEWVCGAITIEPSDQVTQIHISETEVDEEDRMICNVSGSTLSIQYCKSSNSFISFGTSLPAKDLVITVPADWICKTLSIDTASADLEIRDMTIETVDFDGASGMCNLDNCLVTEMEVDVASGDLQFVGILDSLDFDGASADCKLTLHNCPHRIELDGMSGELDITLPSDCGFTVSTEGLSSDFFTDFQTTSRNGSYHHGDGSCIIDVTAMSGNVSIHDGGYNCRDSESHHSGHH